MQNPFSFISVFLGNFFGNFFQFSGFSRLLRNPLMLFVYGIMSKWYISITVAAIVVTYWVFKGLSEAGVIQAAADVVFTALNETKSIAKNCVPQILDFESFWHCLENPPAYEATEAEKALEEGLTKQLSPDNVSNSDTKNPYEQ